MAYTPTNWQSGDTITSARLNKIEQGIASGGGGLLVTATASGSYLVLDKTAAEIRETYLDGGNVVVYNASDSLAETMVMLSAQDGVEMFYFSECGTFYATDESDYPSTEQPEPPK